MKRVFGNPCAWSKRAIALSLCLAFALASALPLCAQDQAAPPDPNQALYKTGWQAFQQGNWNETVTSFTQLIKNVGGVSPPNPQLAEVYFNLAVAQFNLKNYDAAGAAFKEFRDKYPKSPGVPDANFALAQCYLSTKNYDGALGELRKMENSPDPAFRERVLLLEGSLLIEQKKKTEAVVPLEALTKPGLKSATTVRGALLLVTVYIDKPDFVKANAMMVNIQRNLALVDNILLFNSLVISLGDKLLNEGYNPQALAIYHIARTKKEVIQYQKDRLAGMAKRVEDLKLEMRRAPNIKLVAVIQNVIADIAEGEKTLKEAEAAPNFEPALLFREARAYQQTDKPWEASLAYQQIVDKFPDAKAEREPAQFGLISMLADIQKSKRALDAAEQYLKLFPSGPNVAAVSYLRAAMALDNGDYNQAVTWFGETEGRPGAETYKDRTAFLIGNAQFLNGDLASALGTYRKYLADYPTGDNVDEATFRVAICELFTDKYEQAQKDFTAYLEKFPSGAYVPDARYRLAVIQYAASEYDTVIKDCEAWLRQYPSDRETGEVQSLYGDALAAKDRKEEAAKAYIAGYKAALAAQNEDVLNYTLFEAGKTLSKLGHPDQVVALFEEFIKNNPDHNDAPAAIAQIIQARARLGQLDQAKTFAAQTIAKFIGDPKKEAVENLLTQLAALCARKRGPGSDPAGELEKLLTFPPDSGVTDTLLVKARRTFARAELMNMLRKPKEHDDLIYRIADDAKPSDLSPLLLGMVGEQLVVHGRFLPAQEMFEYLINKFPKSDVLDFGYVGLGEIAFQNKDYTKAYDNFDTAVNKIPAAFRIKEGTIGLAKSLLALKKYPDAAKLFEQVAAVKEWRGESTALSIYSLGNIAVETGDNAKATAYYQRVFLGYQKYPEWVAKAYLASGQTFEKMGKTQEAVNTYREMIKNEKIANRPEVDDAKKRLAEMGQPLQASNP